ncbi:hypothetical protein KSP40_PGU019079 [Platanthera guangdongensis]|uniref:Secreted protein n=1 Tax=Platanthera guangdongensis TaxID=2320717 RepID=A0ABR2LCA7_9ASPA
MPVGGAGYAQVVTLAGCVFAARSSPDLDLFSVVVAVVGRLTMTKVRSSTKLVRSFYSLLSSFYYSCGLS